MRYRNSVIPTLLFLLAGIAPAALHAADDTFSCLTQLSGPLTTIAGDKGYNNPFVAVNPPANARYDARGATWKQQTYPEKIGNPYPIQLGIQDRWTTGIDEWLVETAAKKVCWAGGVVIGTNNPRVPKAPWGAVNKKHYGNALSLNSVGGILDGFRADNFGEDGVVPFNSDSFIIKDSWLSHIADDCIENDRMKPGLIVDTLLDGCFMAFSIDSGNTFELGSQQSKIMTLDGVLARLENANMSDREQYDESGVWFKTHPDTVSFKIFNSILAFDDFPTTGGADDRLKRAWTRTKDCKDSTIAWLSDKSIPSNFPTPPSCFKIVKGKAARDLWNAAKQNWINCHPGVGRVPGDPSSNFSQCDTSAYGGGGSGTPKIDDSNGGSSGGSTAVPPGQSGPCNLYSSGQTPPTGYGAAWNLLRPGNPLLLDSNCKSSSAELIVGHGSNEEFHYVYKQGYTYTGGAWQPFTLSGSFVSGSTDWLQGQGTHSHASASVGTTFWVGYVCQWSSSKWNCGCRDSACSTNYWQLQGIVR